jgi:hypothetical protein
MKILAAGNHCRSIATRTKSSWMSTGPLYTIHMVSTSLAYIINDKALTRLHRPILTGARSTEGSTIRFNNGSLTAATLSFILPGISRYLPSLPPRPRVRGQCAGRGTTLCFTNKGFYAANICTSPGSVATDTSHFIYRFSQALGPPLWDPAVLRTLGNAYNVRA